jgi:hypothetical protein
MLLERSDNPLLLSRGRDCQFDTSRERLRRDARLVHMVCDQVAQLACHPEKVKLRGHEGRHNAVLGANPSHMV